jgi:oligoribonuclease (3'-5' exoribonuclease)
MLDKKGCKSSFRMVDVRTCPDIFKKWVTSFSNKNSRNAVIGALKMIEESLLAIIYLLRASSQRKRGRICN